MTCEEIKTIKIINKKDEFPNIIQIDYSRLVDYKLTLPILVRDNGCLKDKAYYLSTMYDWITVKDDTDVICLTPLRKILVRDEFIERLDVR